MDNDRLIHSSNVLDHGYISLVDYMGDDLSPVNDARVSFDKRSYQLNDRDIGLLRFLGREGHSSPFRGSILKFEVYAPLMVARQWWKYVVGSDHGRDPFTQWNESSRRYVTENTVFYLPKSDQWRHKPENSKQGSGETLDEDKGSEFTRLLIRHQQTAQDLYEYAINEGVAPEQARLFLPSYGLYIRWRWTASLQAVCHLINQRVAKDAQKEFQEYAKAVKKLTETAFPAATEVLTQ